MPLTLNLPKRIAANVSIPPYPTTVLRPDDFTSEATFIRLLSQAITLATLKNDNNFGFWVKSCQFWQEQVEWYLAMPSVPMPPRPSPPPLAYSVILDPAANVYYAQETALPLAEECADPAVPPPPSSYIGNHIWGEYWVSLPGDPTPNGTTVTDPRGVFVMLRSPFGGWYLKKG